MVEGLRGLVELARVDAEIATRLAEQAALPGKRENCERRRQVSATRVEAARASIETTELAQRQQEAMARDHQALLEKLEGQQHQVKSNEAYTALLHEMEAARLAMSEAETAVLESMEALDEGKALVASTEAEHALEVAETQSIEAVLSARERELDAEITAFRAQRETLASAVEAKILKVYERVVRRRTPPIAIVSGESCSECRVGIPPQNYLEVRSADALITCGQCSRILIHEVHLA